MALNAKIVLILVVGGILAATVGPASAWSPVLYVVETDMPGQDEAAAQARADTGGRVLNVTTSTQDGSEVFLVKVLLPDGRVTVVTVPASPDISP
jgi:hypothetical protein